MSIISVTHNFGSASRGIELRLHLGWRDCLFDRISNTRSMGAAAASQMQRAADREITNFLPLSLRLSLLSYMCHKLCIVINFPPNAALNPTFSN